tara:strand:+ start:418 stop:675 length:258 start_codon:yes stop_codon:yes gene_type:complete
MSWIPKVMHISYGYDGASCGARSRTWPDKYMADKVARTLPICEKCIELKGTRTMLIEDTTVPTQIEEAEITPLYLKDYIDYINKE